MLESVARSIIPEQEEPAFQDTRFAAELDEPDEIFAEEDETTVQPPAPERPAVHSEPFPPIFSPEPSLPPEKPFSPPPPLPPVGKGDKQPMQAKPAAAAVKDPFSVEEIEAEFARLLGRQIDKGNQS